MPRANRWLLRTNPEKFTRLESEVLSDGDRFKISEGVGDLQPNYIFVPHGLEIYDLGKRATNNMGTTFLVTNSTDNGNVYGLRMHLSSSSVLEERTHEPFRRKKIWFKPEETVKIVHRILRGQKDGIFRDIGDCNFDVSYVRKGLGLDPS